MKPVDQTTFGLEEGNCFSACVASILELPIEGVPQFMTSDDWWPGFQAWCNARDIIPHYFPKAPAPRGYSILGGESPRHPGAGHAVVALDGVMVHDPNPSRMGLLDIWDHITLEQICIGAPAKEEA